MKQYLQQLWHRFHSRQSSQPDFIQTLVQVASVQGQSVDFERAAARVFSVVKDVAYLGGVALTQDQREQLQAEARLILRSDLWAILNTTIVNEASDMSLRQSTTWEHVTTAKMLYHWNHVLHNMVNYLAK